MPTFYFESSGLLKKYKTELGTAVIEEVFTGRRDDELYVTSYLTLIEGYGTFRRLLNNREISQLLFETYLGNIARDLSDSFVVYKVSDYIAIEAARYARDYGLRSADTIHLVTAVQVRDQGLPQPIYFLASDRRLKNVSHDVGFEVLDPEEPDALARLRAFRGC